MRKSILLGVLSFFLLFTPFIYFIKFYALPLDHPEFLYLLLTITAGFILSLGLLWRASDIRLSLVLTLLAAIFCSLLPTLQFPLYLEIISVVTLLCTFFWPTQSQQILLYLSGTLFLSILCFSVGHEFDKDHLSTRPVPPQTKHLPLYIHLIVDEHIGVNAIPQNTAQGRNIKKEILAFYPHYGFTLYTNTYSRYSRTYDSIPNLLNMTLEKQDSFYFPDGPAKQILTENKSFEALTNEGYHLRVYQPAYIDFCHGKHVQYASCFTYPVYSLSYFYTLPFSTGERYYFLLKSYLLSSTLFKGAAYVYVFSLQPFFKALHITLPRWGWTQSEMSSLMTLSALAQLQQDVIAHRDDNSAFFAHILLPHSPYLLTQTCHITAKPDQWLINYDFGPAGNTPARRALRYDLYDAQLACLYKQLDRVFSAWQKAGIMDTAIIVVNGDHSARLPVLAPTIQNEDKSRWQDFNDTFPALFAVHMPHEQEGSIDRKQQTITHVYGQMLEKIVHQPLSIDRAPPYVFLTNDVPDLRGQQKIEPLQRFHPTS